MTSIEACTQEILERGLDDWIQAAEIASVAKSIGGATTEASIRTLALELISAVVSTGLMKPGDLTAEGFREWDLDEEQALARITREWKVGQLPGLGEICWLSNTTSGDQRAKKHTPAIP
jgi:hypothetical protein